MNTKSTIRNLVMCSIAVVLGSMSLYTAAENKGMMSDKEMEKMMRERDSDCNDTRMMGGMGSGMMGGMGPGMMGSGMMGGMGPGMMGSGMMGGMGPGMMSSGMMGSGMMGSGMMGSGMMGSGMMGSGMMGGMGPGMMGGMGPGMMGGMGMSGRMAEMLDITDKQRATMRKIASDLRRSNMQRMSKIMDARDQLSELYEKETLDAKAIGAVYGQIFDLRQQMIEASISAQNNRRNVLSKEQKERMEHMRENMMGR